MNRLTIAGNWKMNTTPESASILGYDISKSSVDVDICNIVICPPHISLDRVAQTISGSGVRVGAQDVHPESSGAFTGEVSAPMLAGLVEFVIVGHSERRTLYAEGDAEVARKAGLAIAAGLTPVVCVGETLAEREAEQTETTVGRQLDAVTDRLDDDGLARIVIAYEPVWAIGTGRTATPAQANAVHAFLRERLAARDPDVAAGLRILYGGSVKAENAARMFAEPDVDGGLIGGASLDAGQFIDICRAAR